MLLLVVNLLSNAIKYNRIDGTVDVSFRIIDQARPHISVRDTGEGLSAHKPSQLFQPFNRSGQEDSSEEGTGIGLVVSKQLVALMGGSIGALSTVGAGSEFWFKLNLAEPHALALDAEPIAVTPMAAGGDGVARRTLLYAQDNHANRELVAQLIARRPDMRLLRAEDGLRGIALAEPVSGADARRFDVVPRPNSSCDVGRTSTRGPSPCARQTLTRGHPHD